MTTYTQPFDEFDTQTEDVALGGQVQYDRNRPPQGTYVFGPAYDGTCFIIKGNLLYYSKPKQPEAWPANYYIEIGQPQRPLQTGLIYNGQVHVFSKTQIWYVQGTGNSTFLPFRRDSKTGAQSVRGAFVTDRGIYHTGRDGIYLYRGGSDTKITENTLEPLFRGETVEGMAGVSTMDDSWLHAVGNRLYFGYRGAGQQYPGNVISLNIDSGQTNYYTYNDGSSVLITAIVEDVTNKRLLIGDSTGFIRVIESPLYSDDSGTAISWDIQSKDFTLQTRAHFPRFVKYDIEAGSATVTGELKLDGASHQTHSVTGSRNTKRRLVGVGNGQKASVRVSGSGVATVYAVEFE